jgi:hypothetical protein
MPYPTCSFIKHDDILCGSPALRGGRYCYHHHRQITEASCGARRPSSRISPVQQKYRASVEIRCPVLC